MQNLDSFKTFLKIISNPPLIIRKIRYLRFCAFLDASQWWPAWKLERHQTERLKLILNHAYYTVPYYNQIFKKLKLKPRDFRSIKDLPKLPILRKEDVMENFDKLVSKKTNKKYLKLNYTSGSTGKPMQFYTGGDSVHIERAFIKRHSDWVNVKGNNRHIQLWSRPFIENNIKRNFFYDRKTRKLSLSTAPCSLSVLGEYIELIRRFRPVFITGNPSMLYHLACYAKENNINDIEFSAFVSFYENLFSYQREQIKEQFKCEIYNSYNTMERVISAFECPTHEGMHIEIEKGILEILNDNDEPLPEGRLGRIIATGFYNYAMPLIRYETGDIGSIAEKPCSCGRGLPLLKSLEGRVNEILRYKDKIVYCTTLSVLLWKFKHIKECQFIQDTEDKIEVNIVKRADYSERDSQELIQTLKQIVDDRLNITINFMDHIPRTSMGKFPFIVSRIKLK